MFTVVWQVAELPTNRAGGTLTPSRVWTRGCSPSSGVQSFDIYTRLSLCCIFFWEARSEMVDAFWGKLTGYPVPCVLLHRFFDFVDIFLKYGVTLLDSNLICCLPCGKFSLFRRFLKLGCPLPSGGQLLSFIHCSTSAHKEYKEWLPYLLLAGFNPVNLMHRVW